MAEEFVPHAYQGMVLERMRRDVLALLLDPGMGKTPICLEDFRHNYEECYATRALVIAPLRCCYSVWPNEAKKWEQFQDIDLRVAHGQGLTTQNINEADMVVTNPASLRWIEQNAANIKPFHTIYVDESTDFKHFGSQQSRRLFRHIHGNVYHHSKSGESKRLIKMFQTIPRRFILTGTPAPNGLQDLFGQFGLLDTGILGESLKKFRSDFWFYPRPTDYGVEWEATPRTPGLIHDRIAPWSVRLDATDHLDLPELVSVERRVRLPASARALYQRLEQEMYVELRDGDEIVALNAGVLSGKCRQVANGQVYLSDLGEVSDTPTRRVEHIHTVKSETLADLWDEIGQRPMLVVFEHRHEIAAIHEYFRQRYKWVPPYIAGDISGPEGARLQEEWNAGNLQMLCVHPQTAARGLNLQAGGHHVVWYSITWNLEWYLQLIRRLWRQGQESARVFVHHIVCEGTVDERIMEALDKKAETQQELFNYLREAWGLPVAQPEESEEWNPLL